MVRDVHTRVKTPLLNYTYRNPRQNQIEASLRSVTNTSRCLIYCHFFNFINSCTRCEPRCFTIELLLPNYIGTVKRNASNELKFKIHNNHIE